jgi:hypothetical protein
VKKFPDAIGGDMEGYALYTAAFFKKVIDWLLIKGISDWGEDTKDDMHQPTAASNAAELLLKLCDIKNLVLPQPFQPETFSLVLQLVAKHTGKIVTPSGSFGRLLPQIPVPEIKQEWTATWKSEDGTIDASATGENFGGRDEAVRNAAQAFVSKLKNERGLEVQVDSLLNGLNPPLPHPDGAVVCA